MTAILKKHFWEWFKKNNRQYIRLYKKPKIEEKYLFNELTAHLKGYCRKLSFELFFHMDYPLCELVISANGDPRFFRRAESLVKSAPVIPCWKITALMQPRPIDFMIRERYADIGIDPCRLWFEPNPRNKRGKRLDITVYSEMYQPEVEEPFTYAVFDVICNVLGEKSIGLNIGTVEIDNLSNAGSKDDILRMEDLPSYVQSMQLLLEVNSKGILQEKGTL